MSQVFDLLVLGGTLVSPTGQQKADIGIRNGKIVAIGGLGQFEAQEKVYAEGLHVLPGVIDSQVHFREPGLTHKEDIESGTRSAICGGVTTILEMPNTNPPTTNAKALREKVAIGEETAWCDFGFFVGATEENTRDLGLLELQPGTPGIKLFMGSSTGTLLVDRDEAVRQVMKHGSRPMPVHSEDEARLRERYAKVEEETHVREHPHIRDAEAARLNTERLLKLCEETGRSVHVLHISTMEEIPLLKEAKKKELPVTCEVTPNHLTLNEDGYETLGTKIQMNPPIRSEMHRLALWHAVKEGLFDVIGSDHAPHTLEEKAKPFPQSPSGMPGVQTLLPLMLDWVNRGEITLEKVVELACLNPANLYGISHKGSLELGKDADLTLIDLDKEWTIGKSWLQYKCGWSPYEGKKIKGYVDTVVLRGKIQVRNGSLVGNQMGQPCLYDWK